MGLLEPGDCAGVVKRCRNENKRARLVELVGMVGKIQLADQHPPAQTANRWKTSVDVSAVQEAD
jgi:hypothetical protein